MKTFFKAIAVALAMLTWAWIGVCLYMGEDWVISVRDNFIH